MAATLAPKAVGQEIAARLGWKGAQLLYGDTNGDVWIDSAAQGALRTEVLTAATARYRADPQVAAVFTATELASAALPSGPPETWTLLDRARASFDPARSGDLVVFLKPRITAIPPDYPGSIATHGSPWDYDRRVPILFWRKGLRAFEQPLSIETIDIMPTLAATVGLRFAPGEVDGRCLDLDSGPNDSCSQESRR